MKLGKNAKETEADTDGMDCVNRDMSAIGMTKDDVRDRNGWRRIVS